MAKKKIVKKVIEKEVKPVEPKVKKIETGIKAVDEGRDDGPGKGKIAIYMIADAITPDRDYAKDSPYNVSKEEYENIKQSCITEKEAKDQKNKMMGTYLTK